MLAATTVILSLVQAAASQPIPVPLAPADATAEVAFTKVVTVRELPDGSLIVGDFLENRLVVIDWAGTESEVARSGDGPREYRRISNLFPLRGDTTLFVDSYTGRWKRMVGADIVDEFRRGSFSGLQGNEIFGADTLGHVLGADNPPGRRDIAADAPRPQMPLRLLDRSTGEDRTIGQVRGFRGRMTIFPARGNRPSSIFGDTPLESTDLARLMPDGWVAVARVSPYRVDWRAPDGDWSVGPPLPFVPVPVDDEIECWSFREVAGLASLECTPGMLEGWPEVIPPFPPRFSGRFPKILHDARGRLVIYRTPTPTTSTVNRYDVVDRDSELVRIVHLPRNQVLVGFGEAHAYAVATDEFDLQVLTRHPWR